MRPSLLRFAIPLAALLVSGPSAFGSAPPDRAAPPHFDDGVRLLRAGSFQDAAIELEAARIARPDHAPSHFYLGVVRHRLGQHDEALRLLRHALTVDPRLDGDVANLYLGLSLEALRLYRQAIDAYKRVVAVDARSKLAGLARARLAALDAMFAAPPGVETLRYYYTRGVRAIEQRKPQDAIDHLEELRLLVAAFPNADRTEVARYPLYLATALNQTGLFARAAEVIAGRSSEEVAWEFQRARALHGTGQLDEARVVYARVTTLAPESVWADAARAHLQVLGETPHVGESSTP